jgi:hypothetical protein
VEAGTYDLCAEAPGYIRLDRSVAVVVGVSGLSVALTPLGTGEGHAPTLTAGFASTEGPAVTFTVVYTDADGDLPSSIVVVIDGQPHNMMAADTTDTDVTDGATYTYTAQLTGGTHTYSFNATDPTHKTTSPDTTPLDGSGASVIVPQQEEGGGDVCAWWWLIIVLVVVLIIVVVVVLVVVRRRGGTKDADKGEYSEEDWSDADPEVPALEPGEPEEDGMDIDQWYDGQGDAPSAGQGEGHDADTGTKPHEEESPFASDGGDEFHDPFRDSSSEDGSAGTDPDGMDAIGTFSDPSLDDDDVPDPGSFSDPSIDVEDDTDAAAPDTDAMAWGQAQDDDKV